MEQIRLGLEEGIDVTPYNMVGFSSGQMKQIRLGLEEGIDVSEYADPFIDAVSMKEARHRISDKWNDEKPALNELQSQEILMGLTSGVDVSLYADPRYTFKEMEKIRLALEREVIWMGCLSMDVKMQLLQYSVLIMNG